MKSDDKPQLLFHAKYLWKALHIHFQRRGKKPKQANKNVSVFASISRNIRSLLHCSQKTTKSMGLCQIDEKFDGFLWAVLTTPFDSLLYMWNNQSSAANLLGNADNYLYEGGGLMVSISFVCYKDFTK